MSPFPVSWVVALALLGASWSAAPAQDNSVYVPLGPGSYGMLFEKVLDAVGDHFEIAYSNRYDGRIETFARVGLALGCPGNSGTVRGLVEGMLAPFAQTRHRADVQIRVADEGGFYVEVRVFRERKAAGKATPSAESAPEAAWVPAGRNQELEQKILQHLNEP
jgi:hypothetical protein